MFYSTYFRDIRQSRRPDDKNRMEDAVDSLSSLDVINDLDLYTCHLQVIEDELTSDESMTVGGTSRRSRIFLWKKKVAEKYLIPILMSTDRLDIVHVAVRILSKLTLPLECLMTGVHDEYLSSYVTFNDLQQTLLDYKKVFLSNHSATASLVKWTRSEDVAFVIDCLLLIRNLLHVPDASDFYHFEPFRPSASGDDDRDARDDWQEVYKKLVWNLCVQGLDSSLLSLLSQVKDHSLLTPPIVQLITLLFKDQHVSILERILQTGSRVAHQESSDDDVDSDSSSSVQRSSSSSFMSNSDATTPSSNQSLAEASSNGTSEDKAMKDSNKSRNGKSPSDSGISSDPRTSSGNSGDDSYSVVNPPATQTDMNEVTTKISDCKLTSSIEEQSSPEKIKVMEDEEAKTEEMTQGNKTHGDHIKKVSREKEQTSGPSNGSSEEEHSRITRKVMKPHHRSACKSTQNESDSSEEYNVKPPDTTGSSKGASRGGNGGATGPFPPLIRSKCSPSVCLDAALFAATKGWSPAPVVPPWDKRRISGSKNFPLNMDSFEPSDEDIGLLLKDFTLKFLHNFLANLVQTVMEQMNKGIDLDDAHLFWLISYFGKLSVSIDLEFHHVEHLLSLDMFGFLVQRGLILNQELDEHVTRRSGLLSTPATKVILRKMHLIVLSIRELFYAIFNYGQHRHDPERESLRRLRYSLAEMKDLRQMLLVYIQGYLPIVHSKQFLVEVITTHHIAMLILEPVYLEGKFDLPLHLRQFATVQVMDHFGKVLQDFRTNSEFVNDCVLTIMHHVAGDLMAPECLFQPIILKTFSLIMESDMEVKDCWGDLIEYIMIRFVRTAKNRTAASISTQP